MKRALANLLDIITAHAAADIWRDLQWDVDRIVRIDQLMMLIVMQLQILRMIQCIPQVHRLQTNQEREGVLKYQQVREYHGRYWPREFQSQIDWMKN